MTRKKRKAQNNYNGDDSSKKKRSDSWRGGYQKGSLIYEEYYKNQSFIGEEFSIFMETLKKDLPTTIRINMASENRDLISKELEQVFKEIQQLQITSENNDDGETHANQQEDQIEIVIDESNQKNEAKDNQEEGYQFQMPLPIEWYPRDEELDIPLAWTFNFPKKYLKKHEILARINNFIIEQNEAGLLSRQEAVSMIPPLLLDVQPSHSVIDMCAAPGSKTCQILEMLNKSQESSGYVVANDVDHSRTDTLTHQLARFPTKNVIITNHPAQALPNLYVDNELVQFDRVLCDVPCSGDGTLRKNVDLWEKWNPVMGLGLHNVQLSIATRAFELLKPGGKMVYSTCSMNPIEDEAVISALLLRYPGKIELVDTSGQLPRLKRRNGISHWRVMDKEGKWYNNYDEVPGVLREKIHRSCFPPEIKEGTDLHLERCMRFLPHDQDTGGFFVAVIQKNQQHENIEERATKKIEIQNNKNKADAHELLSEEARRCWQISKEFYGIKDTFSDDWLVSRSVAKEKPKHVFLLSTSCVQLVLQNPRLRIVSCGFKGLFSVQGDGAEYRILQPAINLMIPYMTEKRIVHITENDFVVLMIEADPFFSSFSPSTQTRLLGLEWGSCVFALTRGKHVSYYVGFRGNTSCKVLLKNNEKANILKSLNLETPQKSTEETSKGSSNQENTFGS